MTFLLFIPEWFFLFFLGISVFVTLSTSRFRDAQRLELKKNFFFLCRYLVSLLVVTLGLSVIAYPSIVEPWPLGSFHEIELVFINDYEYLLNSAYLRLDDFVIFVLHLITFVFFIYFVLIVKLFKQTSIAVFLRHLQEVPLLLGLLFLSLRILLLTIDSLLLLLSIEVATFLTITLMALHLMNFRGNLFVLEGAIKYFLFNSIAVFFFLFGICGYFFAFGNFNFIDYALSYEAIDYYLKPPIQLFSLFQTCLFIGFLIKVGGAPFHQWIPDVYEGVELILTFLLISLISPVLMFKFFILVKLLVPVTPLTTSNGLLFSSGLITFFIGVFGAYRQFRIKRFLAYTGFVHLGFMLFGVAVGNFMGIFSAFFYLLFYLFTNIVMFSILTIYWSLTSRRSFFLNQLKYMINLSLLYLLFSVSLLSYIGVPPFAGFFNKIFILLSLLDRMNSFMVICFVVGLSVSAYLYLRFFKLSLFEAQAGINLFIGLQTKTQEQRLRYHHQRILLALFCPTRLNDNFKNYLAFLFFLCCFLSFILVFFPVLVKLMFLHPLLTIFLFY